MAWVVVERTFEEPQTSSAVQAKQDAVTLGGIVQWRCSYLSRDGLHMACLCEAPDAEAVRQAQHAAGLPFDHVYPCHCVVDAVVEPPPGYSTVIAQRALPNLSLETVQELVKDPMGCNERNRLLHFGGFLSLDGARMVCAYYSPDLDTVRRANRSSGTPYEHLWLAERTDAGLHPVAGPSTPRG